MNLLFYNQLDSSSFERFLKLYS